MRAALLLALLTLAGPAAAQDYVRADCRPLIAPAPAQDSLTAGWYRRFWTGECAGLKGCLGGSPNWNEVVAKLSARSPPAQRAQVLAKACRLGPLIGLEWTRPKKVRRINTGDLRGFNAALQRSGDVMKGLDAVEAQARAKIAGRS